VSPGCEEEQEHQQQPLQVEDGVAVAALQHPDQPKPSSMASITRTKIVSKVYRVISGYFLPVTNFSYFVFYFIVLVRRI
jgi:hypothetical protein